MSGPIRPPLKVQEQDGNPSVRPVNTIKVTNGTLTDDGGAVVSVTTGGGGGGTMDNFDIGADTGAAETVDNGEEIKFLGGTGLATAVAATNAITTTLSDTAVVAGSYTATDLTVDAQGRVTSASSGTVSVEGTAVLSTGETGATKFLREDGDGTSSWQVATATIPDPLRLGSGSAGTPTYSFTSDTSSGMYSPTTNALSLSAGGAERIRVSGNGIQGGAGGASYFTSQGAQNTEISTNGRVNSGTVTIQAGVNQDILIEPDGTGIISFYTGANAWTIENGQGVADQVLTTDGAGAATWEDAGGGGGTAGAAQIIGVPYGFNSGTDMALLNRSPFGTIKTSTKSWSQSGCQCYPFIARKSGVIDTATLYVSATGGTTTGTLDFGIYSDSAGVPNAKLGECSFDPTTASQQTETVDSSVTTVAGTQYWAVLVPNGTDANPSLYANNLTYEMGLGVHSSTFGEGNPVLRSSSDTTLPASFTASNLTPSDFPRYGLGVRYT